MKTHRSKVFALSAMIILAASVSVFSESWETLLKRVKAKYEKFENEIKDMTIQQKIDVYTPTGMVSSVMKALKKGEKFRIEVETEIPQTPGMPEGMNSMKNIVIHNGNETWMISPFLGKSRLSDAEESRYQLEKNWWEYLSGKARITGTETISKRECYIIDFDKQPDTPYTKLWLDKNDLILVKGESEIIQDQHMTWIFSDFRNIKAGWEFPYRTDVYSAGKAVSVSTVESVLINKGIDDSLFDPQKADAPAGGLNDIMKMMDNMNKESGK
ncbi:MAG: hypothetical protein ABIH89_05885 [Elusimicrobiota bacterium]